MKDKEFNRNNEIFREVLVCEKWNKINTDVGICNVHRYWLCKNIEIDGKIEEVMDFLGYRGYLNRKIMGNICTKPEDAVDNAVEIYKNELEKQRKIVENI